MNMPANNEGRAHDSFMSVSNFEFQNCEATVSAHDAPAENLAAGVSRRDPAVVPGPAGVSVTRTAGGRNAADADYAAWANSGLPARRSAARRHRRRAEPRPPPGRRAHPQIKCTTPPAETGCLEVGPVAISNDLADHRTVDQHLEPHQAAGGCRCRAPIPRCAVRHRRARRARHGLLQRSWRRGGDAPARRPAPRMRRLTASSSSPASTRAARRSHGSRGVSVRIQRRVFGGVLEHRPAAAIDERLGGGARRPAPRRDRPSSRRGCR